MSVLIFEDLVKLSALNTRGYQCVGAHNTGYTAMIRRLKMMLKTARDADIAAPEQMPAPVTRQEIAALFAQDLGYAGDVA